MSKKILVAIDRSTVSKQVFEEALSLAKAVGGNLILLHVLCAEESGTPQMSPYFVHHKDRCIHVDPRIMRRANEEFDREWSEFKQQGIKMMRSYMKKAMSSSGRGISCLRSSISAHSSSANAAGVQTEFSQITGHPSTTICDFAQSCHADIVVIGRRGHSGLKELFLGSVSNYVVHHSPCSVLIVQTPVPEVSASSESVETTVCA